MSQKRLMNKEGLPLVTVAVLSYNGRPYLDACLKAVLDQDISGDRLYEVMLVDNDSADGSADYVEQNFPQIRVIRLERNYGCTEGTNQIVLHTKTQYLAIVNQDCIVHRSWLSELLAALESDPKAKLAQCNTIFPWWPEYNPQERDKLVDRAYVCDLTLFGVCQWQPIPVTPSSQPVPTLAAHTAAAMIDLSVIDELGYLGDPDFFCYIEDIDVALRLNALGYKVLFAPKSVAYHAIEWKVKLNWHTVRKAMWSTRNIILAFYKLCDGPEFLVFLPLLLVGNLLKARQHALSWWLKWVYLLAAIPQTTLAFGAALLKLPAFRAKRHQMLHQRVRERWWLFRELSKRKWRSDSGVWLEKPKLTAHNQLSEL